jgi:hypothetical protein
MNLNESKSKWILAGIAGVVLVTALIGVLALTDTIEVPFLGGSGQEEDVEDQDGDDNTDVDEQDDTSSEAPYTIESQKGEELVIYKPEDKDEVGCSVEIEGEVSGGWYFEGDFPIKIVDTDDKELVSGVATAQGEWMTEEKVRFQAKLDCPDCSKGKATIVFVKDDPSGLPENEDTAELSIVLSQDCASQDDSTGQSDDDTQETMTVKVFFSNTDEDPDMINCQKVYSVNRTINETAAVGRAALQELLEGPTAKETDDGYVTQIPDGVKINSLSVENGVARVDFNNALQDQVGGSCRVQAIRAQIEETLKQFSTVDSVVISIEGETELILQP